MGKEEFLLRAGALEDFTRDTMRVNINVSDICNFSCSYCINPASKGKGRRVLDKEILAAFIDDLAARRKAFYHFAVAGGEPLIYPYVEFLVSRIADAIGEKGWIRFATNGSMLPARGERLYALAKGMRLKFSISVHMEQINTKKFAGDIAAFGHAEDISCKILLAPGMLAEARRMQDLLASQQTQMVLSAVSRQGGGPLPYTEEEIRFLRQSETAGIPEFFHEYTAGGERRTEQIDRITRGLNPEKFNYQGMRCMAGANTLRLAPDGSCVRCFGFMRASESFDLTERRLRDIPELARPCVCPSTYCSCLSFLCAPKWRDPEDAPAYLRGIQADA